MAQPPQKAPPPPPPRTRADDHPPPAVRGGHVEAHAEEHYDDEHPRPIIGVRGTPIDDGERDPGTIAEEQRLRSAEMEKMGVEAWKAAHDDRSAEEKGQVASTKKLESEKHP